MKPEEHTNDDEESDLNEKANGLDDKVDCDALLFVEDGDDFPNEEGNLAGEGEDEGEDDVEKEEHEELSIAETDAVGDPGAVVVHVQYAALAGGAVVTSDSYHNYLSGLKLWHSRQYLLLRFSLSSAKKPQ
jgi:hypothetical protein